MNTMMAVAYRRGTTAGTVRRSIASSLSSTKNNSTSTQVYVAASAAAVTAASSPTMITTKMSLGTVRQGSTATTTMSSTTKNAQRRSYSSTSFVSSSSSTSTTTDPGANAATSSAGAGITELLEILKQLDTASLSDADKQLRESIKQKSSKERTPQEKEYVGLSLMDPNIRPLNTTNRQGNNNDNNTKNNIMVGIARTVQCTQRNDFLAVLRGVVEGKRNEILVVNTLQSTCAVAGELLAADAQRKGMHGIIIVDGPMRDVYALQNHLRIPCWALGVTPIAGTCQNPGRTQVAIGCGDVVRQGKLVEASPGDIIVGDQDGILFGQASCFRMLVPKATEIQATEQRLFDQMIQHDTPLKTLTNFAEHLGQRMEQKASDLEFRIEKK